MHLISCGYIRKYLTSRNVNPSDIAQIVEKYLFDDWKFDYCYDYSNKGSTIHGIENGGKTLQCNCFRRCYCFYSTFASPMKPNSGKYKIKFKLMKLTMNIMEIYLVLYHKIVKITTRYEAVTILTN